MHFSSYINSLPYITGDRSLDAVTKKAYRAENARISAKFKHDLFEDLGISDHPKRERLFELAQEHSGGTGRECVYNIAVDLVDLMDL